MEGIDPEIQAMNAEAPLLEAIEAAGATVKDRGKAKDGGERLTFDTCPICGHHDCLVHFASANTWHCFSSNHAGTNKGSYTEWVQAFEGIDRAQAIAKLRDVTGHPRPQGDRPAYQGMSYPDVSKRGTPKSSLPNVLYVLEKDEKLKGRIKMNTISLRAWGMKPLPWNTKSQKAGMEAWKDTDTTRLREYIFKAHGFNASKGNAEEAVEAVAETHPYDPVMEALKALAPWDGANLYAENLLCWFLGAESTEYNKAVSRLMVYAVVERQFNPGAKFDTCVVLTGAQGIGKSTFCRLLALRDEFFTDQVQTLDGSKKDALEKLPGHTVVEVGELNGMSNAKTAETIKAFISAQSDEFRPPYGKVPREYPRRFILVGTTNKAAFLSDPTGNRRFLVVRCGKVEPTRDLFADEARKTFERAYAEALAFREQYGPLPLQLPEFVRGEASEEREAAREEDPYEARVRDWVEAQKQCGVSKVCAQVATEEALSVERGSSNFRATSRRVASILDGMPELVRRCPKKQRVGQYSSTTAWEVI